LALGVLMAAHWDRLRRAGISAAKKTATTQVATVRDASSSQPVTSTTVACRGRAAAARAPVPAAVVPLPV